MTRCARWPFAVGTLGIAALLTGGCGQSRVVPTYIAERSHEPITFDGTVTLVQARIEPATVRPGQSCTLRLGWRRENRPLPPEAFPAVYIRPDSPGPWWQDFAPFTATQRVSAWRPGEVRTQEELLVCPRHTPRGRYPVRVGVWVPDVGWLPAGPEGLARTNLTVEVVR